MGEYRKVNSIKKSAQQLQGSNPLNVATYQVSCLKCGDKFQTIDKTRNRICQGCGLTNNHIGRSKGGWVREK